MQLELLKAFNHNLNEAELKELKKLIANFFADRLTKEADRAWDENGWDDETIESLLNSKTKKSSVKVVIETNVLLVSISSKSKYNWLYWSLLNQEFIICVTTEIMNEYMEIIGKYIGQIASESVLGLIESTGNVEFITPYYKFNLLQDSDDNKFVDCSIAANADYIITNDKDFNILKALEFPKIDIKTIDGF